MPSLKHGIKKIYVTMAGHTYFIYHRVSIRIKPCIDYCLLFYLLTDDTMTTMTKSKQFTHRGLPVTL